MKEGLKSSSKKVADFLESKGIRAVVREIPESTRTSAEAARAIGCDISEIAKSIVFRGMETGKPYIVLAQGSSKINEEKVEKETGEKVTKADAEFAREQTGFAIGGIPPFGRSAKIKTFIDRNLMKHKEIWAAAGTPNSVFSISPDDLIRITEGNVAEVS